jgi:hypothetical protein
VNAKVNWKERKQAGKISGVRVFDLDVLVEWKAGREEKIDSILGTAVQK